MSTDNYDTIRYKSCAWLEDITHTDRGEWGRLFEHRSKFRKELDWNFVQKSPLAIFGRPFRVFFFKRRVVRSKSLFSVPPRYFSVTLSLLWSFFDFFHDLKAFLTFPQILQSIYLRMSCENHSPSYEEYTWYNNFFQASSTSGALYFL